MVGGQAKTFTEVCVKRHFKEVPLSRWISTWVTPLGECLLNSDQSQRTRLLSLIVSGVLAVDKASLPSLLAELKSASMAHPELHDEYIACVVGILQQARTLKNFTSSDLEIGGERLVDELFLKVGLVPTLKHLRCFFCTLVVSISLVFV